LRAFVEAVGNALGIPQRDLIEKDVMLHRLLGSLPESFRNNLKESKPYITRAP
jgi:hypothetical protein